MKINLKFPFLKCMGSIALFAVALTAQAQAVVSGNTISWPNDGNWYVVQNTLTLEVVCEGGTQCTVPDGRYHISRHFPGGGGSGFGNVTVGEPVTFTQQQFEESLVISGLTISYTIPSWYQVQDANTYEEICNGQESCHVAQPGSYIVIFHSGSGPKLRTMVTLGNSSPVEPPLASTVNVDGSTISWPDNGWYMVQRTTDYTTVCEGQRSCVVADGEYNVINLTTQERFENITVGNAPIDSTPSLVDVNGSRISWPDNGWYQVQNATNFATVCEGGRSCVVSPGEYTVINLSTNERFEGITVSGIERPVINNDNFDAIVKQVWEVFSGQAFDSRLMEFPYFKDYIREEPTAECANGGSHTSVFTSFRTGSLQYEAHTDNCLYQFRRTGFGDTISGSFTDRQYSNVGHLLRMDSLEVQLAQGGLMEVDGGMQSQLCCNGSQNTLTDFNYYFTFSGGELRVVNATTFLVRPFSVRPDSPGTLFGQFEMEANATQGNRVVINVDTPFEYGQEDARAQGIDNPISRGPDDAEIIMDLKFGTGVLTVNSPSDSSSVTVNADNGDIHSVSVMVSNAEGNTEHTVLWDEWMDHLEGYSISFTGSRFNGE